MSDLRIFERKLDPRFPPDKVRTLVEVRGVGPGKECGELRLRPRDLVILLVEPWIADLHQVNQRRNRDHLALYHTVLLSLAPDALDVHEQLLGGKTAQHTVQTDPGS